MICLWLTHVQYFNHFTDNETTTYYLTKELFVMNRFQEAVSIWLESRKISPKMDSFQVDREIQTRETKLKWVNYMYEIFFFLFKLTFRWKTAVKFKHGLMINLWHWSSHVFLQFRSKHNIRNKAREESLY